MRLVEGDPVLHSISKSLEAGEGIMFKVFSVSERGKDYVLSAFSKCLLRLFDTYTICVLNHPSYLSSSTCGRSQ